MIYVTEVINMSNRNTNKLVVPGARQALDQMKYEIANEFGVNLGAETTARQNGSVGGEITKRLVATAQSQMNQGQTNQSR
jgi:Small, acid-soluble spore proteins, alpha/beta type